jgi:hypothetical protein
VGSSLHPDFKGSINGVEIHHILKEKGFKTKKPARKLLNAFCDAQDIFLFQFLECGPTVNADSAAIREGSNPEVCSQRR